MIRYLKTFIAAAKSSSFSVAGAQIGLTQSAVSSQIKRLEDEFHCELFDRTAKSVILSPTGRNLLPLALEIIALYEKMKAAAGSLDIGGNIQIGAITSVQTELLGDALQMLKKQFPRVEVNIVPGMSMHIMAKIDSGDIDMGIILKPQQMPKEHHWEPILSEPYAVIAPVGSTEKRLQDLMKKYQFIRYNRFSTGGRQVDQFLKKHRISVNEGMELDEPAVIIKMVERGLGVSIVPLWLAMDRMPASVRIVSLGKAVFHREIGILEHQRSLSNPLSVFMHYALREAAKGVQKRVADTGLFF
ncbi:LysR family transcriptional regulator [Collimonas sp. NPDC087041]|uniref:LysR family transcriptional regulator n=1 Tax=Collimonas sp. NPDC087041 TaxID=3363960 RepID=UPI0037F9EFF6